MSPKQEKSLRDTLKTITLGEAAQDEAVGKSWYRLSELVKEYNVSHTTIINWIKSEKLEGRVCLGVTVARAKPKT